MNPYLTDGDIVEATSPRRCAARVSGSSVSQKSNSVAAMAALRHRSRAGGPGVEVWEVPGTVVRAKVVVADDVVGFGSVDLDAWALYRNSEIMMIARAASSRRSSRSAC